jgi:hypothetical protein
MDCTSMSYLNLRLDACKIDRWVTSPIDKGKSCRQKRYHRFRKKLTLITSTSL